MRPVTNYEPISLCPLNRRVDVVYYGEPELFRVPVVALAIVEEQRVSCQSYAVLERRGRLITYVEPEDLDANYLTTGVDRTADNFLGYEFDGIQQDWVKEIEAYKKRQQEKR
ncbi:MAG: hypothetical protein A4E63_00192 [Syntrophorhabdus sp. PtaU1.Bin050]|nr:MAG: hypothetical protein A4E63_00192 [Syntrophorhabdus sp. PtaU1.Bin050]